MRGSGSYTVAALQLHTKEGGDEGNPGGLRDPSSHQGSAVGERSNPFSEISRQNNFHNLLEEDHLLVRAQPPGAFPILLAEQFNLRSTPGIIKITVNVLFIDWLKPSLFPQKEAERSNLHSKDHILKNFHRIWSFNPDDTLVLHRQRLRVREVMWLAQVT